ncbi:MAG: TRSP domain-containing protein [Lachnospiraceae bacterium]|nr:MAG: TRSP domain-containing protein [Lachnospiraceae bacterium]
MSYLEIKNSKKVLILGTEEYMFVPMMLASVLKEKNPDIVVKNHATTRSPIMVSNDRGYPLKNRAILESCYEKSRKTYLYNLEDYDLCVIMSDSIEDLESYSDIISAVNEYGCCRFYILGKE